jgi:hypothetical protein
MASNSIHSTRRGGWRFFLGLSVLALLIVASACHAGNRLPAGDNTLPLERIAK